MASPESWSEKQNGRPPLKPTESESAFQQNPWEAPVHTEVGETLLSIMVSSTSENRSTWEKLTTSATGVKGSEVLGPMSEPPLSRVRKLAGITGGQARDCSRQV